MPNSQGTKTTVGVEYNVYVINTDTGKIVSISGGCDLGGNAPQPPPPAPAISIGREATDQFGAVTTHFSPPVSSGGYSQLETWMWCDDPGPSNVSVAVGPWEVAGGIQFLGMRWDIDGPDGQFSLHSPNCGKPQNPDDDGTGAAAVWTPNNRGQHEIAATSRWGGEWSLIYNGNVVYTEGYEEFELPELPTTYRIWEIQSVGVAND